MVNIRTFVLNDWDFRTISNFLTISGQLCNFRTARTPEIVRIMNNTANEMSQTRCWSWQTAWKWQSETAWLRLQSPALPSQTEISRPSVRRKQTPRPWTQFLHCLSSLAAGRPASRWHTSRNRSWRVSAFCESATTRTHSISAADTSLHQAAFTETRVRVRVSIYGLSVTWLRSMDPKKTWGLRRNVLKELKWECYVGSLVLPWRTGKGMTTSVASLE